MKYLAARVAFGPGTKLECCKTADKYVGLFNIYNRVRNTTRDNARNELPYCYSLKNPPGRN